MDTGPSLLDWEVTEKQWGEVRMISWECFKNTDAANSLHLE